MPILTEKNKMKRLEYCNIHKNDLFTNVIFSDESKFEIFANSKKIFVKKSDDYP
jgi:hypothetical protein